MAGKLADSLRYYDLLKQLQHIATPPGAAASIAGASGSGTKTQPEGIYTQLSYQHICESFIKRGQWPELASFMSHHSPHVVIKSTVTSN